MLVKLLMTWDIKKNRESAYFEFVVKEFGPGMLKLGLHQSESWYTVYGSGPQILVGGVTDSVEKMKQILNSSEWRDLKAQLLAYVNNFQQKVVPASGRFQL